MAYEIWKIDGFNPCRKLNDGELVFYVKCRHSPNIKLSVGKYYDSKGSVENGDYEPWHVIDLFDGKKRLPYMSEIMPINDFKASNIKTTWCMVDDHGHPIENK